MKLVNYSFKIIPFLVLVTIITLFTSCNDWLDIEPENDLIQQEFWKTRDDIMSVVGATYDSNRGATAKSFYMGEVRADHISAKGGDYFEIGINNISISNEATKWYDYYNTINLANTVMHYAPIVQDLDQTLTDPILHGIEAEMLFLRSLSYFYLVRIWKDVPLVLSGTISDTVDFYIPKSTESVVLRQIQSDLKKASAMATKDELDKGRANKYAIQALMADILLWSEDYDQCILYCDSLINSGLFGMESNDTWFNLYYPGNSLSEGIFELQYNDQLGGQENPFYYNDGVLNNLNIYLSLMAFDKETDIRYCGAKGPGWKFIGKDETGSASKRRTSNERDANYIYYRYAEILLIKAEALAEIGNFEDANFYLRQVAERAGTTHNSTNSLTDFRTALLAERGREFGAEGKRWFDVLRFAKKNGFEDRQFLVDIMLSKARDAQELAVMKTKVVDTMSYYLPIHVDELKYNKNLVQNPFYDR